MRGLHVTRRKGEAVVIDTPDGPSRIVIESIEPKRVRLALQLPLGHIVRARDDCVTLPANITTAAPA